MSKGQITDVPGIKIGNMEDMEALTGCTVIMTEAGATAGVDVRGSAPGTRETDLLNPINLVDQVHAIVLSGGSAFGLDAASGVMQYLEENGFGFDVGVTKVPIVPAAVLFDLALGNPNVRPDKEMGYRAAAIASPAPFLTGNRGAGCGATVGKLAGLKNCMKGGLGSASYTLADGTVIGAIVAVNPVGDVRNPATGEILAGPYDAAEEKIVDSLQIMEHSFNTVFQPGTNTTIGVVAVNASLTKAEAAKIAQMAQDGFARTIYPAHSTNDGDTIFAIGTGGKRVPIDILGSMAAKVMELAILDAIYKAESVAGIPAYTEIKKKEKRE